MNLRDLARGQQCMCRFVGICNHDPSTTVLAHLRRAGVAGVGQKPADLCAVWACSACHDEIDRRTRVLDKATMDSDLLDALVRQLAWYDRNCIVEIK